MVSLLLAGTSEARLASEALRAAREHLYAGHAEDPPCPACRRILARIHPDFRVVELRISEKTGKLQVEIAVDDVRAAIEFAAGLPYEAQQRVVWIADADKMNESSANALLKSLEEPGSRMTWILTTTRPEAIPATVRSRCARRRVDLPPPGECARAFRGLGLSEEDAADAAAFGLDPDEGGPDLAAPRALREQTIGALRSPGASALLALADATSGDPDWPGLASALLRDAAAIAAAGGSAPTIHRTQAAALREIAAAFRPDVLADSALALDSLTVMERRLGRTQPLAREAVLLKLSRGRRNAGSGG